MESKSQWYYENQGKAEGPISTLELVQKIRDNELSLLDLIFKEGEGQWMPAEHFPEIKNLIKTTPTQFRADSDWIVLRTLEIDGREHYDQIGPFTIEQILQLLDKGRIKFTDHVWRNGYENWVPLGRVDEFESPLDSSVQVDLSIYEKPRQEDLFAKGPVVAKTYRPSEKIRPVAVVEDKPQEARGEDLARPPWEKVIEQAAQPAKKETKSKVQTAAPKVAEEPPSPAEEIEDIPENTERRIQRAVALGRWQAVTTLMVLIIFVTGASLFFIYGKKVFRGSQSSSQDIAFESVGHPKAKIPPARLAPLPPPAPQAPKVAQRIEEPEPPPIDVPPPPSPIVEKPVVAAVSATPAPKAQDLKPLSEPKTSPGEFDFLQMTAKQKSYFLQNERLFLFYQAQRGQKLVAEINKMVSKPDKKKTALKTKLDGWMKQVQKLERLARTESREPHLYPDFYRRLAAVSQQLESRGGEIQSQLINGRGPSKEMTLREIEAEYKKIMMQARDLD